MNHFSSKEFNCKCGKCGKGFDNMQASTLAKLEQARTGANIPFVIMSAVRCSAHNKACGGKPNSAHLRGHAVDIVVGSSGQRLIMLTHLLAAGFTRIGIGANFIHADDDPTLPQGVAWLYPA